MGGVAPSRAPETNLIVSTSVPSAFGTSVLKETKLIRSLRYQLDRYEALYLRRQRGGNDPTFVAGLDKYWGIIAVGRDIIRELEKFKDLWPTSEASPQAKMQFQDAYLLLRTSFFPVLNYYGASYENVLELAEENDVEGRVKKFLHRHLVEILSRGRLDALSGQNSSSLSVQESSAVQVGLLASSSRQIPRVTFSFDEESDIQAVPEFEGNFRMDFFAALRDHSVGKDDIALQAMILEQGLTPTNRELLSAEPTAEHLQRLIPEFKYGEVFVGLLKTHHTPKV
jgi:hypothetical protein